MVFLQVTAILENIYAELEEFDKALEYQFKSLELGREIGDQYGEAATLANIGVVYGQMGDLDEALKYYLESQAIREGIGDQLGASSTLNNIGTIYLDFK